jgi:hypothetical protein
MADKKVSVTITAKDGVTGVLRGIHKSTETWSHQITKIAAGIGLVDSFKHLGRFIRDSVNEAADAYPRLGAGLKTVADGFQEVRIQAGAAFLEVLRPAVPILRDVFDWAAKLAKQLPNAFDGFRIVMAGITGWFRSIPAYAEEAFGRIATAAAAMVEQLPAFLRLRIGLGAPAALREFGGRTTSEAEAQLATIQAETDRRIQGLASATHHLGPRALTKEQEKEKKDAEQKRIDAGVRQAEIDIRGQRGPRVVGDRNVQVRSSGLGGVSLGELPSTLADSTTGLQSLGAALSLVKEVTPGVAEGLDAINNSLLGSIPGFGQVAKAAQKAVGIIAKVEGAVAIAKGSVKVAESIWPFNPAGLQSGLAMIAEGTKLSQLGGGGGGGGRGSFSSGGFVSSSQQAASGRVQEVRIKANPGDVLSLSSPGGQRIIAEAVKAAQYARLIEIDLTAGAA